MTENLSMTHLDQGSAEGSGKKTKFGFDKQLDPVRMSGEIFQRVQKCAQ
jgi:hypothetical protein